MSGPDRERPSESVWRTPLLTWAGLIGLLVASAGVAFAPLGPAKTAVNLTIAVVQVGLIGLFLMRLTRSSSLVRMTAIAGFFWLALLFVIAGADYLTRP